MVRKNALTKVDKSIQKVVENEAEEGSCLFVSVRDGLITLFNNIFMCSRLSVFSIITTD